MEKDLINGMSKSRYLAIHILNIFEHFLDEENITIPSDDRNNNPEEARIHGEKYYNLEDEITALLEEHDAKWKK